MFWGLVLEPGKRYSTTVEKSFHVSKAALDCSSVRNDNEILSVMLETEGSEALLCNLCKQKGILQEGLDLNFMTGDRLTFECRGHGRIHLSGYLLPDDDDMSGMLGDEESEEEEEEEGKDWSATSSPEKQKKEKRKADALPDVPSKKKKVTDGDEGDSDSDQDEESDLSEGVEDEDLEDEEDDEEASDKDDDDDDDDDEGEEEESEDEEDSINLSVNESKKQKKENRNKTPNKQNVGTPKKTPVTNGVTPKEQKSNKKTPSGDKTPNTTPKHKQLLDNGVTVKEMKVGKGTPAKFGRTVAVYYVGKLKDTNKVFDKQFKGEGFKFKLGKGEVIKGWDIGVQGMKVGGKRLIHCPPEAAYGAKGVPPKIPPNSTLTFEVELKKVY